MSDTDYSLLVGPVLLGTILNTYLYGIVTIQFLSYYEHKFKDSLWTRVLVSSLFVIDTVHTAVNIWATWDLCVTNYTNPDTLNFSNWTIPFTAIATALAAFLTQAFLGQRVVRLSKNRLLGIAIGAFSVAGFIFGLLVAVRVGQAHAIANFPKYNVQLVVGGWLISQTVADIAITSALLWYLSSARTGFVRTDRIIQRLMRGAVQTGLFASMFAMGDLLSFYLLGASNLYVFFVFPLGRIYTNTLLETLNSRSNLKSSAGSIIDMDSTSNVRFHHGSRSEAQRGQGTTPPVHAIRIQTEVYTTDDDSKRQPSETASTNGEVKGGNAHY